MNNIQNNPYDINIESTRPKTVQTGININQNPYITQNINPLQNNLQQNTSSTTQSGFNGNGNLINADPLFINPRQGNFKLNENSPAKNKGLSLISHPYFSGYLSKDILQKERLFPSELGCYENN